MPYLIDVRTVKGKGGPLKADVSIDKLVIVTVTRGKSVKKLKKICRLPLCMALYKVFEGPKRNYPYNCSAFGE